MKSFKRTKYCDEIDKNLLNKKIFLSGWVQKRRDLGSLIFIDLRDRSGLMQLVFNPEEHKTISEYAHKLRPEFVISVEGLVVKRKSEAINKKLKTGEYELQVSDLLIINQSETPPFQLEKEIYASEDLRLKYRYLDLRRKEMHNYIKLRHDVIFAMREYLNKEKFYEIETPILSKSTPEGARDFLVPSRMQPGTFYALPQSPQLYKQLLMTAGMEKYFQIARCFRDEDLRSNRQPEFTQLDIEMSFVNEQDIIQVVEDLFAFIWKKIFNKKLQFPFPKFKYDEIFSRFGTDKPDMRFSMEIQDFTQLFKNTELKFLKTIIDKNGKIGAICIKNKNFSRSEFAHWEQQAKQYFGANGLLQIKFQENKSPVSSISKFLPQDFFAQVKNIIPDISINDTLFLVADKYNKAWTALGYLRATLGKELNLIDKNQFNFLWITDFPLLEWSEEDNRWYSVHHPFTSPYENWETLDKSKIKSRTYDLVCNGEELGGGSIRIHNPEIQSKIFKLLGIDENTAKEKFGFLLEAQKYGFPPHGGIGFGLDRIIILLCNAESIRDVIAFPKTTTGSCLMTKSPSQVDEEQLKELHIKITK